VIGPLLKWPGGKMRLAERISRTFDAHGGRNDAPCRAPYVEPFAGSLSVYLWRHQHGLIRGGARLSDVNARLIGFYRLVRDAPGPVADAVDRVRKCGREQYEQVREHVNASPKVQTCDEAARFLWLNRAGFNGLYRENARGQINVPAGAGRIVVPSREHILAVSRLLQGASLAACDFRDALSWRDVATSAVYADPPYLDDDDAAFTSYAPRGFSAADHADLARLASRARWCAVSNADSDAARAVYGVAGFVVSDSFGVRRAIGAAEVTRGRAAEVIFSMPSPREPGT